MATAPTKPRKRGTKKKDSLPNSLTAAEIAAKKERGLSHPLRIQIMQTIDQDTMSPSQLALALNVPLPNLSYHIRMLVQLGFLKLVRTRPRRGAIEHYYATTGEWERYAPLRPGVVDVELGVLRHIVRKLATHFGDGERVQFTTDGDEVLLNLSGDRYRIYPDRATVKENPMLPPVEVRVQGADDGR